MAEDLESSSVEQLKQKISAAKKEQAVEDEPSQVPIGATRISIELVAGVMVGSFLGYHLDRWLETSPIFFILCFFLGVAGGALNIYKLAREKT